MNDLEKHFRGNTGRKIHKFQHYFEIYDRHFSRFRETDVHIVEFGVSQGGSLQMWKKYFGPNCKLFGIDINPHCKTLEEKQVQIFIGDQEDRNFLKMLANKIPKIDILIDDGGHTMAQQINTFEELFFRIDANGVYLCEDLHTSYWRDWGGGHKRPGTFIEYSKNFIDYIHAWYTSQTSGLSVNDFTKSVHSLHYYDSILVIEKRPTAKPVELQSGKEEFPDFLAPMSPLKQLSESGWQHYTAGRWAEAQALYKKVLAEEPHQSDALRMLALAEFNSGNHAEGLNLIREAVQSQPWSSDYAVNLGQMLMALGRHEEAVDAYRQALQIEPHFAPAHRYLGNALKAVNRPEEAIAEYRQSLVYQPDSAEANNDLGNLLLKIDQIDEALLVLRKALASRPDFTDAWINYGNALHAVGQMDDALAAYNRALAIKADHPGSRWNLGLTYLMQGDYPRGWAEYEWRFKAGIVTDPNFFQPRWAGEDLNGKRLLIHAEQGMGDTLQFCRYLPLLAGRGGKIVFQSPQALARLMQRISGVDQVIPVGEPLPPFDLQCPLGSLPNVLKTTLQTIPNEIPYLQPDPARIQYWRNRVPTDNRLKVGLVWGGRAIPQPLRSMPLTQLAGLANVQNVWFCSLQKGEASAETRNAPGGLQITDWTTELTDFAETAALIANLDLVIAVDTSVAHLAGALGKPVWIMLRHAPDWRWFLGRSDSPWYPTAMLFRQPRPGEWNTPVQQIIHELQHLTQR